MNDGAAAGGSGATDLLEEGRGADSIPINRKLCSTYTYTIA